jgi:hypothetical protein
MDCLRSIKYLTEVRLSLRESLDAEPSERALDSSERASRALDSEDTCNVRSRAAESRQGSVEEAISANTLANHSHTGGRPMIPSEVFIQHAAECESMAKFSRDPESKQAWRRMAERWVRCAALARQNASPPGGRKTELHRRPALASSNSNVSSAVPNMRTRGSSRS